MKEKYEVRLSLHFRAVEGGGKRGEDAAGQFSCLGPERRERVPGFQILSYRNPGRRRRKNQTSYIKYSPTNLHGRKRKRGSGAMLKSLLLFLVPTFARGKGRRRKKKKRGDER